MIKKIKNLVNIPRSIFHYKIGSLSLPYLPNALWIEPTNVCNLKCIMCPNSIVAQKNPGFMDLGLYEKIIDEAKDFASYIVLCISGESLLHKDFTQMVSYAKKNGLETYLSTNATLLTPELSRRIIEAGLDWINFSFDGVKKETYEKTRVNADFDKTLQNIIDFLKIKKELKSKIRAELQILLMDENGQKEYAQFGEEFLSKFKNLPLDSVQTRRPSTWGKHLLNTEKYQPIEIKKSKYSPCSYLWSSLHILWDGKIVACTSDFFAENILGKFPENTLEQIWNGEQMNKFRGAMIRGEYLNYNKNCEGCDSLWDENILGLPPGIRGISALTFSNIFGKSCLSLLKLMAGYFSPEFAMRVIKKKNN
jgi:radical SAM protein with 4Fe4S-binding SPASM domain